MTPVLSGPRKLLSQSEQRVVVITIVKTVVNNTHSSVVPEPNIEALVRSVDNALAEQSSDSGFHYFFDKFSSMYKGN